MELFSLTGKRDLKQFYDSEILNYKKEYSKCWSRLISYIKDLNETYPFSQSKLRDKERQLLKDRFAGFNKEFEEIYERQKRYYIPAEQSELAQILRQDNDIYIVTQYKKFYDAYSNLDFATNKDKYVRYSPELLSARLREFFTGD
jgi:exocyst complex protein 7